jgi:hypothetical protein
MANATLTTPWQGQNYLDGRWRPVQGEYLENMNPARCEEVLGLYPRHAAGCRLGRDRGAARVSWLATYEPYQAGRVVLSPG